MASKRNVFGAFEGPRHLRLLLHYAPFLTALLDRFVCN
jgi:hypothetical protein